MSKDLKKRGFNFVGSTICYAFMQATGMVNDHAVECFRYRCGIASTARLLPTRLHQLTPELSRAYDTCLTLSGDGDL